LKGIAGRPVMRLEQHPTPAITDPCTNARSRRLNKRQGDAARLGLLRYMTHALDIRYAAALECRGKPDANTSMISVRVEPANRSIDAPQPRSTPPFSITAAGVSTSSKAAGPISIRMTGSLLSAINSRAPTSPDSPIKRS